MTKSTITPVVRFYLWLVVVVIAPYGLLVVYPAGAGNYWAWQIAEPRTAVLVGAVYFAATFYYIFLAFQKDFVPLKGSLFGLFLVAGWLLVVGMFHWDVFYPYRLLTLSWLAAYYFALLGIPVAFRIQAELERPASEKAVRVSGGWRAWYLARAIIYAALSVGMFVFASRIKDLWPWPIEVHNVRMFSGQIFVFGAVTGLTMREGFWPRVRLLMILIALLATVHLVGILTGVGPYAWTTPFGLILPIIFIEWLAVSLLSLLRYK